MSAVATRRRRTGISPLARRVARELGVDVETLAGSGPNGRVIRRDVERAAAAAPRPAPQACAGDAGGRGPTTAEALTRIQRTVARRMAESRATVPDFTLTTEVDMDAAVGLRAELARATGERPPSYNDMVVKACALALREHPRVNGSYADGRFELHGRVNVGVAVAAPDTLVVPTVFDADRRSLGDIASETRRLAAAVRDRSITAAELAAGTFSVSNLGMYGVTRFTAIVNPPQAAILAVGALRETPVVRDGAVVPGTIMELTLACDHRILSGADGAAFLAGIRERLEHPVALLL
jgi:pyruvate dehydrogenase E2 component (dihydrolipoamide acetyltransferase)